MDRLLHPAETQLFIAAALRGHRLQDTADGQRYRIVRFANSTEHVVADCATFKDIANMYGATGRVTLRQAAERDGLTWPTSAEDFLAALRTV